MSSEVAPKDKDFMNGKKFDVFLVDDCPSDLLLHKKTLEKSPIVENIISVQDAKNFVESVIFGEYYSDLGVKSHIILLDIHMPELDGISILSGLRSHPLTEGIPVFMLTGDLSSGSVYDCYRMKADSYIPKPLDLEQFHSAVEKGWNWDADSSVTDNAMLADAQ